MTEKVYLKALLSKLCVEEDKILAEKEKSFKFNCQYHLLRGIKVGCSSC